MPLIHQSNRYLLSFLFCLHPTTVEAPLHWQRHIPWRASPFVAGRAQVPEFPRMVSAFAFQSTAAEGGTGFDLKRTGVLGKRHHGEDD